MDRQPWEQPEHMSSGHLVRNPEQPAQALEVPEEGYIDEWGRVFDEHLATFFTNYAPKERRVAIPVPIFNGATTLGIYGPGYILGYSLTGVAGKLATFTDSKTGYSTPILSVGFDARGSNTESFASPLLFNGELACNLNDPSITGVLYIEKIVAA